MSRPRGALGPFLGTLLTSLGGMIPRVRCDGKAVFAVDTEEETREMLTVKKRWERIQGGSPTPSKTSKTRRLATRIAPTHCDAVPSLRVPAPLGLLAAWYLLWVRGTERLFP